MDCHDRVKQARIAGGYQTATQAARAMGVKAASDIHHETAVRLEWHNAPAEDAVELQAAWRYLGSLPGR
jgi:hypothetical protein